MRQFASAFYDHKWSGYDNSLVSLRIKFALCELAYAGRIVKYQVQSDLCQFARSVLASYSENGDLMMIGRPLEI